MLGSLAQSALYLTDSVFVGRLGQVPLAAVGLGGLLFYFLTTVGAALAVGLQVQVARRVGQGRPHAVGRLFDNTLWLSLGLAVGLALVLGLVAPALAAALVRDAAVADQLQAYLRTIVWALPASFGWHCVAGFCTGIGRTRQLGASMALMTLTNVGCNYLWVWGGLGSPALGIAGSAGATAVSEVVGLLVAGAGLLRPGLRQYYGLGQHRPTGPAVRRLLLFAAPILGKQLVETAGWFGFFVLVGQLGSRELAVSNLVRSVYTVVSLPSLALSSAIYTLTSRYLGQGRPELIGPVVGRSVVLSLAVTLLPVGALLLWPLGVGSLFTAEAGLHQLLESVVPVLAVVLLLFAVSNILYNSLLGLGGAAVAFRIELVAIGAYLAVAAAAVYGWRLPLAGVWASEIVYWLVLGGLASRFLRRRYRQRLPQQEWAEGEEVGLGAVVVAA